MKEHIKWQRDKEELLMTQLNFISKDVKTFSRLLDNHTARLIGFSMASGVIGWFTGPTIARRFIVQPQNIRLSKNIARTGTFAALMGLSSFANRRWTQSEFNRHPRRQQIQFIQKNLHLFFRYTKHLPSHERGTQNQLIMDWFKAMKQEPLYRNEKELINLLRISQDLVGLWEEVYRDADEKEVLTNIELLERFYMFPAIEKVYGIKIRHMQDLESFLTWQQQKEEELEHAHMGRVGQWTLGAPEKEEEFWKWFNDPSTGKPMKIKQSEQTPSANKP